ncbi:dienelactone hydrolase family protein [Rhodococcus aetherivorans]|uniref:dienelactone hydrolase family protein n=1 Tax=Rhodococcus aetherivorans TaxID=191292 RepID=UPI001E52EBFC|nr:dienelactone hydrolase family protein [Rhodococcus aetherivorans]UGQ39375.1 dienelactone hydrolase family protein [Rhodococcus aetherivorans]
MNEIRTSVVAVGPLQGYLAAPRDGSGVGMVLLPMITGIGAQVRAYAEDIAATGITALVWDPFHGPNADDTPRERLYELMNGLDDDAALAEIRLLTDHLLGELGAERVGMLGYCLGGRLALLAGARDERLANVIAYHPSIPAVPAANHTHDTVADAARIAAPVMVLHAGADTIMTADVFADLQRSLLSRTSGATIVHVYPGAEHGFSTRARHGNPVNADAYALSWPQALNFMAQTLAAGRP